MPEAYIIDAARTPVGRGREGGALAGVHPADLGARVISALMERSGADPGAVEDVVFGCVDALGPQSGDIARTAWLAAGLPEHVPGVTVDRQCGSGQQAVHFAAQAVMAGTADLVVAGGVQSMSAVPIGAAMRAGQALARADGRDPGGPGAEGPFSGSQGWRERYGDAPVSQFAGAEAIASDWGLTRRELEDYAAESHRRAVRAADEGRFAREVVPVGGVAADEGTRRNTSPERMAELPVLVPDGVHTAATASQVTDGAAALLIAGERAVEAHGLVPRARIHHMSVLGEDPIRMLSAPIPATARALDRCGMSIGDMDTIEVNEAFAAVVLAWLGETGADPERVNPNGGAIALGHPLGATGARLMVTLLHELERAGGRWGLQTMCEGGGQANVTVIERVR